MMKRRESRGKMSHRRRTWVDCSISCLSWLLTSSIEPLAASEGSSMKRGGALCYSKDLSPESKQHEKQDRRAQ
jgi:hypothetical protein